MSNDANYYYQLAKSYTSPEQWDDYLEAINKAIELDPNNPIYHLDLVMEMRDWSLIEPVLARLDNLEDIAKIRQARWRDTYYDYFDEDKTPLYADVYWLIDNGFAEPREYCYMAFQLGHYNMTRERMLRAIELLNIAHEKWPENIEILDTRANIYWYLKDYPALERDCRLALALIERFGLPSEKYEILEVDKNRLHYMLHVVLCISKHYQASLDEFDRIPLNYPHRFLYYTAIAKYYLGRYEEALEDINAAEGYKKEPPITDIHAYIAAIEERIPAQNKVVSGEISWMNKLQVLKHPLIFKRTDDPNIP